MNQSFRHINRGLDWLFPRVCYGCNISHQPEKIPNICIFCWAKMAQPHRLKLPNTDINVLSAGMYEGALKKLVIQSKFKRNSMCTDFAFALIYSAFEKIPATFDYVTSIPPNYLRSMQRGIDLPGTLAFELSKKTGIEFRTNLLKKGPKPKRQGLLSSEERVRNMQNAFEASNEVKGKTILVIDDIVTTGSTLNACYKALKRRKPARVVFLTIAKTRF